MKTIKTKTLGSKNLPTARRKSVAVSQESWIKTEHLLSGKDIPFMVQPAMDGMSLVDWAKNNRAIVDELLLKHKALLFRNFNPKNVEEFQEFVKATSDGKLLGYKDRSTPRKDVGEKIYLIGDLLAFSDTFVSLIYYNPLLDLIETLLDTSEFEFHFCQALIKNLATSWSARKSLPFTVS